MTTEELVALWEKIEDENKPVEIPAEIRVTSRADVNAFILLDKFQPQDPVVYHGDRTYYPDMVSCAEHDEIWLDVQLEALAKVITEPQIRILSALGVHIDSSNDSLHMFV